VIKLISKKIIGIIGTGKMGEALISGLTKSKLVDGTTLNASDAVPQRRDYISKKYNIQCYSNNQQVVKKSDIVILAVQPKDMKAVLDNIRDKLTSRHLLISIAAGVSIDYISRNLKKTVSTIRAMPNNPCMIGEGMITITPTTDVSEENIQAAKEIFNSIGKTMVINEAYFDAVTALSGSGPAYIYLVIEALADGGVKVGIPKDFAIELAAQTVLGSARMVLETQEHPAKLKDMVATPGGTTVTGLMELEQGKIRASFIRAVEKATKRAKELTKD
jgi:pyrroline-5-carboxylate reductase